MRLKILSILALSVLLLLSAVSANHDNGNGFSQDGKNKLTDEEKTKMEEKRKAIEESIESGDYERWKALLIEDMFSQERFNRIVEQHKKMLERRQNQTGCGDFRPMQPRYFEEDYDQRPRMPPQYFRFDNNYGPMPPGNFEDYGNHYGQFPQGPDNR